MEGPPGGVPVSLGRLRSDAKHLKPHAPAAPGWGQAAACTPTTPSGSRST